MAPPVAEPIREKVAPTPVKDVPERTNTIKIIGKTGASLTPSITAALSGNVVEKTITEQIGIEVYNEYDNYNEPFTREQLELKWREFLNLNPDRPNLISTLSNFPEVTEGNKLLLKIGNSVQEEEVRLIKPELVGFLKKELRNSGIELNTIIERVESERTHYSDSEKIQIMMQKNPELYELKQKFNLDFNA